MAKKMPRQWRVPILKDDQRLGNGEIGLKKGSLLHYEHDWDGMTHDPATGKYVSNVELVGADDPISGTMVMDDGIHSGRSAKYVSFTHQDGRTFYMFIAELVKLVKTGDVRPGGVIRGQFRYVKRGNNFGIEYVGP